MICNGVLEVCRMMAVLRDWTTTPPIHVRRLSSGQVAPAEVTCDLDYLPVPTGGDLMMGVVGYSGRKGVGVLCRVLTLETGEVASSACLCCLFFSMSHVKFITYPMSLFFNPVFLKHTSDFVAWFEGKRLLKLRK